MRPSGTYFAPELKYLTPNFDTTVVGKHNRATNVPMGSRFNMFQNFDLTGNSANTTVQRYGERGMITGGYQR